MVYDLWGNTAEQAYTENMASLWTVSGFINSAQTLANCGGFPFLGGPGLQNPTGYLERTYWNFATHDIIYFSMYIAAGGAWQAIDTLSIQFDDQTPWSFQLSGAIPSHITSTCIPSNSNAMVNTVLGKIFHQASSVTVRVSWNFQTGSSPAPFIGIKELVMLFGFRTSSDIEGMKIGLADTSLTYSTLCSNLQYWRTPNNDCQSCVPPCRTCFGLTSSQCYSYAIFAGYDGTASFACSANCRICSGSAANQCNQCEPGYYLFPNGGCQASCPSPKVTLSVGSKHICVNPCASSNQFMLWNYTCVDSCDSPLVPSIDNLQKTCPYPCRLSIHSYLYWNGSCLTTCPAPYSERNENNYRFCDACQPDYYSYSNDACLPACPALFTSQTTGGSRFCLFPCPMSTFIYPDGSCSPTCTSPYCQTIADDYHICFPISPETKNTRLVNKVTGLMIAVLSKLVTFADYANPSALFMSMMTIMPKYLRYIGIDYPQNLQQVLDSDDALSINITPDMPNQAAMRFSNFTLPAKFDYYQLPSSFTVNFWSSSITLTAILAILLLACCLKLAFNKRTTLVSICKRVEEAIKWNYLLITFISCFGELAIFSSFEFLRNQFGDSWGIISFLECLIFNFTCIYAVKKAIYVILSVKKEYCTTNIPLSQLQQSNTIAAKLRDYQILFEICKKQSLMQLMFVLFVTARISLFYLLIAYMYQYPLQQVCLINLLNILMLTYLLKVQPLQHKTETAEYVIQEIVLLAINICVLVLATLDRVDNQDETARRRLGSVIIYIETGYGVGGSAYLICKLLGQILSKVRAFKNKRRRVQVITLPTVIEGTKGPSAEKLEVRNSKHENMSSQLREENSTSIDHSSVQLNDQRIELEMSAIDISNGRLTSKNKKACEILSNEQSDHEHSFSNMSSLSKPDTHQRTTEPNINQSRFGSQYENSLNIKNAPSNSNKTIRILNPSKASLERNAARRQILENVRAMNDPKNFFKDDSFHDVR